MIRSIAAEAHQYSNVTCSLHGAFHFPGWFAGATFSRQAIIKENKNDAYFKLSFVGTPAGHLLVHAIVRLVRLCACNVKPKSFCRQLGPCADLLYLWDSESLRRDMIMLQKAYSRPSGRAVSWCKARCKIW